MLVALAGVTALAASSQAVIVLTPLDSSVTAPIVNEANITPAQLSNGAFGLGPVTDTGGFTVSTTNGLSALEVGEVSGLAFGGDLTLTVLLDGSVVLYSDSSVANNPLTVDVLDSLGNLTGTHTVTYTATFTGFSPFSEGYLGGFKVDAFEAVPEPASFGALTIGAIGLIARKRRSGK